MQQYRARVKSVKLTSNQGWRYRRIFWMVVGLVLGIWMAEVVVGWIVHFLSGVPE